MYSFRAFNACTTWFDSKDYTQQKHSAARSSNARETIPFWYARSSVLTFRSRPLSSHLGKARFSHTREVWSFDRYEHETHYTSLVRSWTRPIQFELKVHAIQEKPNASGLEMIVCVYTKSTERFKYHFYAIEVKLSLNFKFIGSSHTKRMDFFSVYIYSLYHKSVYTMSVRWIYRIYKKLIVF